MSFPREPLNPMDSNASPRTAMILRFMTDNGHPSYVREIEQLREYFNEIQQESGPSVQEKLNMVNETIREIAQAAIDRYDDWVSDMDPFDVC